MAGTLKFLLVLGNLVVPTICKGGSRCHESDASNCAMSESWHAVIVLSALQGALLKRCVSQPRENRERVGLAPEGFRNSFQIIEESTA